MEKDTDYNHKEVRVVYQEIQYIYTYILVHLQLKWHYIRRIIFKKNNYNIQGAFTQGFD